MKRGSALKWIELIKNGNPSFNLACLGAETDLDPFGILCDFIHNGNYVVNKETGVREYGGQGFFPDKETQKRCHMKSPYWSNAGGFVGPSHAAALVDLVDHSSPRSKKNVVDFIEKYYQYL